MWTKCRARKTQKEGQELREAQKGLNINKEYQSTMRSRSYDELFSKAQPLITGKNSSSSNHCPQKASETLLEPCQEAIPAILDSAIFSKFPGLKPLLQAYFDVSAEASKICTQLLKGIKQIQLDYQFIQEALDTIEEFTSHEKIERIVSELNSFIPIANPFSSPDDDYFKLISENYKSVLTHLKSMGKRVKRKSKLIKSLMKASALCLTAACAFAAIAGLGVAAHTLAGLLIGPALFTLPLKGLKKKLLVLKNSPFRSGFLRKVGEQLDVAAKGTYILNRDFDTMGRIVARLHDEVEHNKSMVQFCLDRGGDKFLFQVVKELRKPNPEFSLQVEELEEHLYLCLVTINRSRASLIQEMASKP